MPGLRFGYLVTPEPLQDALRAALQRFSVGYVDVPVQAALARFLEEGLFARHLRRARAAYAERRALVLEAIQGPLSRPSLELVPCQAGLHITTVLRDQDVDDTAVVAAAAAQGVVVEALSSYAVAGRPRGVVLGYGAADTASIRPGLRAAGSRSSTLGPGPDEGADTDERRAEPSGCRSCSSSADGRRRTTGPAPRRTQVPRGSSRSAAAVPTT